MNNRKPLVKRVAAYLIDLSIIVITAALISSIPGLNKENQKYQEVYKEYEEKYNQYAETIDMIADSYEDEVITEEEYNKLLELEYSEKITAKYDDLEISEKEYQEIVKEINQDFDNVVKDYVYLLNKNNKINAIISLILTLLYFGVFQYLCNGQTIGKRLLKIRVVSVSDKKLNVLTYILRTLLVNDVFLNTISVIFLITATKKVYTTANGILETLISICEAIILFTVLTNPTGRGLHDVIFKTQVVIDDSSKEKILEVKEEQKEELTKPVEKKKSTAKKQTNKKTVDAKYKEKTQKKK